MRGAGRRSCRVRRRTGSAALSIASTGRGTIDHGADGRQCFASARPTGRRAGVLHSPAEAPYEGRSEGVHVKRYLRSTIDVIFGPHMKDSVKFVETGVRVSDDYRNFSHDKESLWHPANELEGLPNAPDPLEAPNLPIPCSAAELAAFMVSGVGVMLTSVYAGAWGHGPDPSMLMSLGDDAAMPREALRAAYAALRDAEASVGKLDQQVQQRPLALRARYDEENGLANQREGVFEPGVSNREKNARRARASESVATLLAEAKSAEKLAASEFAQWRRAIVQHLLRPSGLGSSVPPRRTGIVDRAWIEATRIVGRNFTEGEVEGGWPEALEPHRLATLQYPTDHVGQSYLNKAAIAACKSGDLRCVVFEHVDHFPVHGETRQVDIWTDYLIKANDFAGWWLAKGELPSAHIAAWWAACGLPTGQSEKTATAAMAEGSATAGQGMRLARTPKAWTKERIEEARAMKATFKGQGIKDFEARTAEHYGVTPARLRAVLASPKNAQTTKKSRSTWHSGLGQ